MATRKRAPSGAGAVIDRWKGSGPRRGGVQSRWEGRYSVLADGRRVQRSVYAPTQREALAKLAAALGAVGGSGATPRDRQAGAVSRLTVGAWLAAWLTDKQESTRHQTFRRYSSLVEHLKAGLGDRPLPELTVADVERFLAARQHGDRPLSPRSVGHLRAVLRAALNDAVRHGHVASNAAQLARPPRVEAKERRDWTPADRDAYLRALEGTDSHAPAATAFYAGLRQGEMLGLRWLDVDPGVIHVRRAAIWKDGRSELAEPKSASSRRDVPVSPTLATILAAHRHDEEVKRQQLGVPSVSPDDRVFTTAFAAPYNPTVQTHAVGRRLRAAGLEPVGFHAFRHAFGSLLVSSGAEVLTVSRLMGHSGIAVTANVYLRSPKDQMAAAVRLLG